MEHGAQHSTLCHSTKSVMMSNSRLSSFMNRTYCLLNKYLTVSACQKAHSGACSNFGVKQGMLFDTIMVLLVVPMYSPLMMWTIYFNLWTTILTGSSMNCQSYSSDNRFNSIHYTTIYRELSCRGISHKKLKKIATSLFFFKDLVFCDNVSTYMHLKSIHIPYFSVDEPWSPDLLRESSASMRGWGEIDGQ